MFRRLQLEMIADTEVLIAAWQELKQVLLGVRSRLCTTVGGFNWKSATKGIMRYIETWSACYLTGRNANWSNQVIRVMYGANFVLIGWCK